jgi:uncharacterized protein (DUF4415 family)
MGKIVRYTTEELKKMRSESNWERLKAMTDEEIEAVDTSDEGIGEDWMDNAIITRPNQKQRVYALYDAYVINYFKRGGRGYQQRMNAVLKAYVDAQLAKENR